jgi:hypothetical protein
MRLLALRAAQQNLNVRQAQSLDRRWEMRKSNNLIPFSLVALLCLLGCRSKLAPIPTSPPDYGGQVSGRDFRSGTGAFGQLSMLRLIPERERNSAPIGFARIDSATTFIFNKRSGIDSTKLALPGLQWAHVRVWFNAGPTSRTADEIWGNARLIIVDSAGVRPATTSSVRTIKDSL